MSSQKLHVHLNLIITESEHYSTKIEFILGGPADTVVLKKLLQQFLLVQELQALNSARNKGEKLFSIKRT